MNEQSEIISLDVLRVLQEAPSQLASAAKEVQRKQEAFKKAQLALRAAKGGACIKYQGQRNQTLIKAYCDADAEVNEAEKRVIEAQKDFEIAKIEHGKIYDEFISARKIAGIDSEELAALQGQTLKRPYAVDPVTGEIIPPSR